MIFQLSTGFCTKGLKSVSEFDTMSHLMAMEAKWLTGRIINIGVRSY